MSLKRLKKHSTTTNFSHVQPFKVVVFGQEGVGKTAFIVRFATGKFIGEYDRALEYVYQCSVLLPPANPVYFEILDTCGKEENDEILIEKIKWADAFILVYSVTDRVSFTEITRLKFSISHHTSHCSHKSHHHVPPIVAVVGNKKDMEVERMVTENEGRKLAEEFNSLFFEISVRESTMEVADVFEALYNSRRSSIKSDTLSRAKSNSLLELPIVSHHLPTKKFKHINKFPRMQGSPEMRRSFRTSCEGKPRSVKLSTEFENSGDEGQTGTRKKKTSKTESAVTKQIPNVRYHFSSSSSGSSSDDFNSAEDQKHSIPYSEDFARQIAEDFHKKTVLLTLE